MSILPSLFNAVKRIIETKIDEKIEADIKKVQGDDGYVNIRLSGIRPTYHPRIEAPLPYMKRTEAQGAIIITPPHPDKLKAAEIEAEFKKAREALLERKIEEWELAHKERLVELMNKKENEK